MHEDVVEALEAHRSDPPERDLAASLLRPLALTLVPVAAAIVAAMVHRDYTALFWPPSPVLLLAPLVSYLMMRRVATSDADAAITALGSALVALFASWIVALVLGLFAALECLEPGGGCIPW